MSAPRRGLRRRVAAMSLLLGACLSVLFGGTMVAVAESYEHILIDEILRGQAEDYARRMDSEPGVALPRTHRLSGYLRRPDGRGDAPTAFAALPPGIHEIGGDDGQHVGVFDTGHGRFYFVIDLSDIERLEQLLALFLIVVLLGGTALAGWLGWLMAGTTIAPVTRLAAAVDALPAAPQPTALAREAGDDELGRLAQAFDGYQQRLVDADAAERAFFADASHELRTPVAVVRGAVELLAEEVHDAGAARRVLRLERGVAELTDLIDILFGLVRRRDADARAPAREVLARALAGEPAELVEHDAPPLPERETTLLVRSIVRRLRVPGTAGALALHADARGLEIFVRHGEIDAARTPAPRSDRGHGLTLAARLAASLGWRIEERAQGVRLAWD